MNEREIAAARDFLRGLSIGDLRALGQVLGPAVAAGLAGRQSIVLVELIGGEFDQREKQSAAAA